MESWHWMFEQRDLTLLVQTHLAIENMMLSNLDYKFINLAMLFLSKVFHSWFIFSSLHLVESILTFPGPPDLITCQTDHSLIDHHPVNPEWKWTREMAKLSWKPSSSCNIQYSDPSKFFGNLRSTDGKVKMDWYALCTICDDPLVGLCSMAQEDSYKLFFNTCM